MTEPEEDAPHPRCPLGELKVGIGASSYYVVRAPMHACIWLKAMEDFQRNNPGVAIYKSTEGSLVLYLTEEVVEYHVTSNIEGRWLHAEFVGRRERVSR